MANTIYVTQKPVVLDGYQAVMKPGKFGYSLSAIVEDESLIERLEQDREEALKWCESKLKNPKRATKKPEPWEEVEKGKYQLKFYWKDNTRPSVVDSEGTPVTDEATPLFGGAQVKLAFRHKPYVMESLATYGTSLKLVGIQIISLKTSAGVDTGDLDDTEVAAIFGQTQGYKSNDPNVTPTPEADDDEF